LSVLFALGSCSLFLQKLNKKIIISMVVVVVAGLAAFGTSVGLVSCQSWQYNEQTRGKTVTSPVKIDNSIKVEDN